MNRSKFKDILKKNCKKLKLRDFEHLNFVIQNNVFLSILLIENKPFEIEIYKIGEHARK